MINKEPKLNAKRYDADLFITSLSELELLILKKPRFSLNKYFDTFQTTFS